MLNSRRVISKAAIYDAVYGMAEDQPFDKVIDVYICKIRKKIGQAVDATAAVGARAVKRVAKEVVKRDTQAKMAQREFGLHHLEG